MKRTPLKRGKPLARRSKKTADRYRLRRQMVKEELSKRPWCEAGALLFSFTGGSAGCDGRERSTEIHEPLMRSRGGDMLDRSNTVAICRMCHDFVTFNTCIAEEIGMARPKGNTLPAYDRIMSRVRVDTDTGCYEYLGYKNKAGYPWVSFNDGTSSKPRLGNRIVWEHHNGEIPEGMLIRHDCDNPKCVNPEHLRIGDKKDNAMDAKLRNRLNPPRGRDHPKSKLSNEDVENMILDRKSGMNCRELAEKYGVDASYVSRICSGARKTWMGPSGREDMPHGSEWTKDRLTEEIVGMRRLGMSTIDIAKKTGKNPGTVWRILKRAAPDTVYVKK